MQAPQTGVDRWTPAFEKYERPVRALARENWRKIPGMGQDDLEQELLEVLWAACEKYDPDKGAKFNTFFRMLVNNRIATLIRNAFVQKRQSNLFCETLTSDDVAAVVDEITSCASAETEYLARLSITEHRLYGRVR